MIRRAVPFALALSLAGLVPAPVPAQEPPQIKPFTLEV